MAAAAGRHGGVNTPSFHSGGGGRGRHGQLGGACEQSVRAVVVGLTATGAAVVTDCMHGAAAVAAVTTVSAWAAVVLVRPHSLWYSALLFLLARAEAPCTTQGVITAAPPARQPACAGLTYSYLLLTSRVTCTGYTVTAALSLCKAKKPGFPAKRGSEPEAFTFGDRLSHPSAPK